MECACVVDIDLDGEAVKVVDISDSIPAYWNCACDECGHVFQIGERHQRDTFHYDNHFGIHRTCHDCKSMRHVFFSCFYYGMLWDSFSDFVSENLGEISERCIANLTPRAREMALNIIETYYEEFYEENGEYP